MRRAALAASLALGACTATVTPPVDPPDPVRVYLLVDERHHGLIMPDGHGAYVEYGYGEWLWYAKNETGWYRAFPTLLWPTRGTLGRRTHHAADEAELRALLHWMRIDGLDVARADLEPLRRDLHDRYESRRAEEVYNPAWRFWFVPDEDGYSACWTCADALGGWFEALGCRVSRVPIRIGLVVRD